VPQDGYLADAMLAQWVVKLGWFTIGNALGFAANVLGMIDSRPARPHLGPSGRGADGLSRDSVSSGPSAGDRSGTGGR
jgi:hypothetical protein